MNKYTVNDKRITGNRVLLLTLAPLDGNEAISYQAGQYVSLGFKVAGRKTPMRSFSIVSSPTEPDHLQVAMRVEGDFTRTAAEIPVGAEAFLQGPFGEFTLNPDYDQNVVLLAGGIGVTPFISMLREARDTRSMARMTLLYSCRDQSNIPFYEELLALERASPNVRVVFFVTGATFIPETGVRLVQGGITDDRLQKILGSRLQGMSFFVCGPNRFMNHISSALEKLGVPEDWIITESFSQSSKLFSLRTMSLQAKTYVFSGAAVAVAVGVIMLLDLMRYVPKVTAAQAALSGTTTSSEASSPTAATTQSPASTDSSGTASTPSTTTPTNSTSTNNSNYNNAVSSVS